jgi:hypothetical protein
MKRGHHHGRPPGRSYDDNDKKPENCRGVYKKSDLWENLKNGIDEDRD